MLNIWKTNLLHCEESLKQRMFMEMTAFNGNFFYKLNRQIYITRARCPAE